MTLFFFRMREQWKMRLARRLLLSWGFHWSQMPARWVITTNMVWNGSVWLSCGHLFVLGKTLSFTKTGLSLYYFTEFKVWQLVRHKPIQTDRWTDTQMDTQKMHRQTDAQTDRWTERQTHRQMNGQMDRQMNGQAFFGDLIISMEPLKTCLRIEPFGILTGSKGFFRGC